MPSFGNLLDNQNTATRNTLAAITKNPSVVATSKIINPGLDETWGGATSGFTGADAAIDPYNTYYFSGQDIHVMIDGTEANANFNSIPVINLAFQITQPKMAIYGFWSYTYDAIAYGARQIGARMMIATTYPNYMTNLLQEVAKERLAQTNNAYANTAPLSTDDQNILNFWGTGVGNAETGNTINLYQQHPPFDIIVTYGNQSTNIVTFAEGVQNNAGNNPLFLDTNERLVLSAGPTQQIKLEACEITSMSTQYSTSGDVLCETYDLIVNDISMP